MQFQFYKNNGDGSFQAPVQLAADILGSEGAFLVPGDFNGDGKLDFALGEYDIAAVVFGNGDGTFQLNDSQPVVLPTPGSTTNPDFSAGVLVAAADMNGDGTLDVAVADDGAEMASVSLNDGKGNFTSGFSAPLDAGSGAIQVADLNGDGLPDLVITNYKTQNISIFLSIYPKTTPVVNLIESAPQLLVGSTATLTVQLNGSTTHPPTGTVTLASGSTSYGQQTVESNGDATFTLSDLPVGQYPFIATYSGDAFNAAASNATPVSESITDFQVALAASSQSVSVSSDATYNVMITPLSGFTGSVSLACSGLPTGYSCAPAFVTLQGQPGSTNLVVSPPASATVASRRPLSSEPKVWLSFLGLCLLGLKRRKYRFAALPLTLVLLSLLVGLGGCSGSSTPSTSVPTPYTGTSTFTISATTSQGSATITHQASANLTVHQ